MIQKFLTDEDVEREIERLQDSEAVALARKENYYKNRRRQYMYTLRSFEKRGKELQRQGVTMADFEFDAEPEME